MSSEMTSSVSRDGGSGLRTEGLDAEELIPRLPPIDGGRRAWSFLVGAFMIEGLLDGFPYLFGVFQEYLRGHSKFGNDPFLTNVGTLSLGIAKLLSPAMTPIIIRYKSYRRQMIWAGWVVCMLALVLASFATELWHLVLFQGLLFGIGWSVLYYPLLGLMDEWFVVRRGFAYGVLFGSGALFGLGMPILIRKLLITYGYAWTMRIYAIATLVLVGPTLPLFYGRNPIDPNAPKSAKMQSGIFSKVAFSAISFSNLFQGLVVFLPTIFIPSFATAIGLSGSQGTLILSITNVAKGIGMLGFGYLADKCDALLLALPVSLAASLSAFFLWGYAKNFAVLFLFSIANGLFTSSYSVLYSRFASFLSSDASSQRWLYSVFEAQRGALVIIGGIMGGKLVGVGGEVKTGYGVGRYRTTILVVGTSLALSALGGVGWFLRSSKFKFQAPVRLVNIEEERARIEAEEEIRRALREKAQLDDVAPRLPSLELHYMEAYETYRASGGEYSNWHEWIRGRTD